MRKDVVTALAAYVEALHPIVYINHFDFHVIDQAIAQIDENACCIEFNHAQGQVDFKTKSGIASCSLVDFLSLNFDEGFEHTTFIVLKNVHDELKNPQVISWLIQIAEKTLYNQNYNATIFIVSPVLVIPPELENYISIFDQPLPELGEIHQIIDDFIVQQRIKVDPELVNELCLSLKGLNEFQIQQVLNLAYQDGGYIDASDKQLILREKQQLIKKAGMLELVDVFDDINDVGGLVSLKKWLKNKARIFADLDKAIKFGVDVPKGVLIIGMPGCGKSITAKATARLFEIPLVRLDVGRLLGKYVGESEANMRKALLLAEAISPCVLWVDEIEKAFAGMNGHGSSNDVTVRLFGQFLTWMQEKKNTVFIVATANDIECLPPEFLRKGRFDELFFVDLPDAMERKEIMEIHLKKRHHWSRDLDLLSLLKDTEGYNGADLEAVVKNAIETAFIEGHDTITKEDLLKSVKEIKSISESLKNKISSLRESLKNIDIRKAL